MPDSPVVVFDDVLRQKKARFDNANGETPFAKSSLYGKG
jgi:hypothetical protein